MGAGVSGFVPTRALEFVGDAGIAGRPFKRVLVFVPDDPDVRLALGAAYWYGGSREQGMNEWREILRRDPNFERARSALAEASNGHR